MRSERIMLLVLLAIPLVVALVGWPAFVRWAAGPSAPTPTATPPNAVALSGRPASQATEAPPATVAPHPLTPTPRPVQTTPVGTSDDPSAAVTTFYGLVSQHQFDAAAQLWSPRMQASFPPSENISRRFSQTQALTVQRADLISEDTRTGSAAVAVNVLESRPDGDQHWVGTWYLVRGPNGWLLDQPQLSGT